MSGRFRRETSTPEPSPPASVLLEASVRRGGGLGRGQSVENSALPGGSGGDTGGWGRPGAGAPASRALGVGSGGRGHQGQVCECGRPARGQPRATLSLCSFHPADVSVHNHSRGRVYPRDTPAPATCRDADTDVWVVTETRPEVTDVVGRCECPRVPAHTVTVTSGPGVHAHISRGPPRAGDLTSPWSAPP